MDILEKKFNRNGVEIQGWFKVYSLNAPQLKRKPFHNAPRFSNFILLQPDRLGNILQKLEDGKYRISFYVHIGKSLYKNREQIPSKNYMLKILITLKIFI